MKPCIVKQVSIGGGKPKICVPIVSATQQDILDDFQKIKDKDFDIIELRIDFFTGILEEESILALLKEIKLLKLQKPIIFTYRSKKEGGNIQLDKQQQYRLLEIVCTSETVDIIDIEYQSEGVQELIRLVHKHKLVALLSNHNFSYTPSVSDMQSHLLAMERLNGDILKIAVMPKTPLDVLALLETTYISSLRLEKPIISMAMSGIGAISRMSGEIFGSAVTFAMIGKPSAPGQIDVEKLKQVLDIVHLSK